MLVGVHEPRDRAELGERERAGCGEQQRKKEVRVVRRMNRRA